MEFTGERVVFDRMNNNDGEVRVLQKHLERYVWALQFVRERIVLDAACGTGYGTWLLSLVADVIGYDKDIDSIIYAEDKFPFLAFERIELDNEELQIEMPLDIEVVVSFETIEHLSNPQKFLDTIRGKELVFSIPIDAPSEFHKTVFKSAYEIQCFIESFGWEITDKWLQDNKYFVGRAV